jgi:hypothetical protein
VAIGFALTLGWPPPSERHRRSRQVSGALAPRKPMSGSGGCYEAIARERALVMLTTKGRSVARRDVLQSVILPMRKSKLHKRWDQISSTCLRPP